MQAAESVRDVRLLFFFINVLISFNFTINYLLVNMILIHTDIYWEINNKYFSNFFFYFLFPPGTFGKNSSFRKSS